MKILNHEYLSQGINRNSFYYAFKTFPMNKNGHFFCNEARQQSDYLFVLKNFLSLFIHSKILVNKLLTLFNTIIIVDILNLRFSSYIFATKVIV